MENSLLKLFKREKVRQVRFSILLAILVSASVLAASLVAFDLLDDGNPGGDIDDLPNTGDNDYVLGLSSFVDQQYVDGNIVAFKIHGNATQTIHPSLIASELTPSGSGWDVDASVVVNGDFDMVEQVSFTFSQAEMADIQQSFLTSLDQTSEVDPPAPQALPSAQSALSYTVLYDDGTGFEFLWLGFDDLDIVAVNNVTWSENSATTSSTTSNPTDSTSTTTVTSNPQLSAVPNDFSYHVKGEEARYIGPLGAFDSFILKLSQLYTAQLDQ